MFQRLFALITSISCIRLLFSFLCCNLIIPCLAEAAKNHSHVLILSSYHIGFGGTDPMVTGIRSAFSRSGLDVNFHIEYLDSKRFSPDVLFPVVEQLYKTKFEHTKFDVILVADNNAFNFIRQSRDKLFPDTPVVFCGINNYKASMIEGIQWITGVAEDISLKETVELALSLHPETTHLAVLSDSTTTGAANLQKFNDILPSLPKEIEIVRLSNLSAKELADQLKQLPELTVLLQLSFYMDREGRDFTQKEQMAFILEYSNVPIYSAWDFFIAHGVLGGIVTYFPLQGEIAGDMAVQLMKGTPVTELPVITNSPNIPLFDYEVLDTFHIPLSHLPKGSIVLNLPQTFYSQNKALVWSIIVFVIIQSIIILALLLTIRRKRQTQGLLFESEEKYRQLYQQAPVMLHKTDMEGRLTEVNELWLETLGYIREDVLGKQSFGFLTDKSKLKADALLPQLYGAESLKEVPIRFATKTGERIDALVTVYVEKDLHGNALGTRAAIVDITESNKVKSEKKRLEGQLLQSQKLESIGQLAGGVAHDLNNLLSPILGYSELLLLDSKLEERYREKIDLIEKAGTGARDLVRQLLAFSRKQTLAFSSININDVIMNYADLLQRTIREDIVMSLSLSPEIKQIQADLGQIEQVIMNLVINAADSMADGGKLIIETTVTVLDEFHLDRKPEVSPGEYVTISCSDTGCGMDEETCKHIFEPFFSTKGEMGTGLGLATVYGIIKQHKGNVWVYSEPGKGTTFKIYLPVSDERGAEQKSDTKLSVDLKGNENILLVEDNVQVMNIIYDMLQYLGYNVQTAKNGKEAITLLPLRSQPIQLLLTDVIMPDMNGRELFSKLSEIQPGLKVIYISGYTDDVIAHHGVLDEGVHFIQKPFATKTIAIKIREVLDQLNTLD